MVAAGEGGAYVAGQIFTNRKQPGVVTRYSADGSLLWAKTFDASGRLAVKTDIAAHVGINPLQDPFVDDGEFADVVFGGLGLPDSPWKVAALA
jgi:hypothetical protein